jgi:hypothetical protein
MCTSYEPNPHDRFDAYRLFDVPAFDFKQTVNQTSTPVR